ncbi:helix-turn-helix transcriptional regulator [Halobaculum sp. MBLA0147]|uniref:helix-turn-helix transcriptional regulator n=1 Tax=Halobaculum sp. MBLA0147 TaxID=3079934 RepID=UPI003524EC8D
MRHAALLLVALLLSTTAVVPAATAATAAPTPVETAHTTPDTLRDAPSGLTLRDAPSGFERTRSLPTVWEPTRGAESLDGSAGALAGRAVTRAGTTFTVSLRSDGDALWAVRARYRLSGPAERAAFDRLAGDYEDGNATVGPDPTVWRRAATRAADATGRTMTVQAVDRRARLVNDSVGELRLRFEWTAFANRTGPRQFRVGDAFRTSEGSWLPRIGSNQTVVLEAPPDSRVTDTGQYPLDDARIRVAGPQDFTEQPLTMAYTLAAPTTTTPPPSENRSPPTTSPPTASPVPPGDGDDTLLFGAALLAVVLAVVALIAYQGGLGGATVSPPNDGDGGPTTDTGGGSPPGASADATVENGSGVAGTAAEPDTETAGSGGDATTGGTTAGGTSPEGATEATADDTAADDEETEDDERDVELLSDEERVERLLERNGGRMRQADIVSETGWSDAKVSQLLSAMADEGRVDKLRLGRENLISFPDVDDTPGNGGED